VDQVQNVELDRYPHRFLMEFELPEPGAWTRWLHLNDASRAMINKLPLPLTLTGLPGATPLTPNQLGDPQIGTGTDYRIFVARYNVQGVNPPNPPTKMVALNLQFPQSGTDPKTDSVVDHFVSNSNLAIPDGYTATSWSASVISVFSDAGLNYGGPHESSIVIAVGQGPAVSVPMNNGLGRLVNQPAGPISDGSIPVALLAQRSEGFEVNIAVTCSATQTDTFAQISSAYTPLVQAYNNEKAGLGVQQTNLGRGRLPGTERPDHYPGAQAPGDRDAHWGTVPGIQRNQLGCDRNQSPDRPTPDGRADRAADSVHGTGVRVRNPELHLLSVLLGRLNPLAGPGPTRRG
jgi:hypothetical protein